MISEIYQKVSLLVLYQGVFDNAIGKAFITLLSTDNVTDFLKAYVPSYWFSISFTA